MDPMNKNVLVVIIVAGMSSALFASGLFVGLLFADRPEPADRDEKTQSRSSAGGAKRQITLVADENVVQIAPDNELHPGGVWYNAMTFNGTVPGPMIFANQGDMLEITLINHGETVHSLNFHAGLGPTQALSGALKPGESKTWMLHATNPSAFLYHCDGDNVNGIWEHIANGMYGGFVIRPQNERAANEFYVVFSEIYNSADAGLFAGTGGRIGSFDFGKFMENRPDLILTNGMAYKYIPRFGTIGKIVLNENAEAFTVEPEELTRWYIINAGPRSPVAFNFGSGMIYVKDAFLNQGKEDDQEDLLRNDEIWTIPPGSGSVIEAFFPEEGVYFGNDHDIGHLLMGGGFVVRATSNNFTSTPPQNR